MMVSEGEKELAIFCMMQLALLPGPVFHCLQCRKQGGFGYLSLPSHTVNSRKLGRDLGIRLRSSSATSGVTASTAVFML